MDDASLGGFVEVLHGHVEGGLGGLFVAGFGCGSNFFDVGFEGGFDALVDVGALA